MEPNNLLGDPVVYGDSQGGDSEGGEGGGFWSEQALNLAIYASGDFIHNTIGKSNALRTSLRYNLSKTPVHLPLGKAMDISTKVLKYASIGAKFISKFTPVI